MARSSSTSICRGAPCGRPWAGTRPAPTDPVLERLPFQQFHSDERSTLKLVYVVNRADVGMIEGARGSGFALEAFQHLRVGAGPSGRNLSATKRPSFTSSALYTTPIPPPPSFS